MDTQGTGRRKLPRILTMAALACFALPFLTVTCYGDTTVSGVQAATGIDIYPNDDPGERELTREEPPNGFALVALVAAVVAVAVSSGSTRSRQMAVWAAVVGVIALEGFFAYAYYRSWGGAWPRIGFAGALMLLVGSAWAGVGRIPRWVGWVIAGVAASMIPGTVIGIDALAEYTLLTVPVYASGFVAMALAVGAIRASMRPPEVALMAARPSALRMVFAGLVGFAFVAIAVVGAVFLMSMMLSGEYGPDDVGSSYTFAIVVLATSLASSVVAWIAGRAIVNGRRRTRSFAPERSGVIA